MITIDFEKRGSLTLTECIYESLRKQILDGSLHEGEKLPSKRALALHLGVSVITVQNAYLQLIDEGFLFSIEKKGFFVSDIARHLRSGEEKAGRTDARDGKLPTVQESSFADFSSNAAVPEMFPFSLWSKTMRQVLATGSDRLLRRTDVFGALELRRALCRHLKEFRGMDISEGQIIIGAGTESLYSMLVQFLGREGAFAVENPGYHKAEAIFRLNGASCVPVMIDGQGMDVDALESSGASVAHVSPSHHFPTGVVMSFARRKQILSWACRAPGRYIIEDDYDSEFRFTGKALPTLQGIDNEGRVIYMNTFSKTLSPSFRISYMVLPQGLIKAFSEKLGFYSCQVSSFEQFTLARFIEDGSYERHINKMKNYYRSLRNNLITAFNNSRLVEAGTIHEENSGLHFLLTMRKEIDARELQERWRAAGIHIQLLSNFYYGSGREAAGGGEPAGGRDSIGGGVGSAGGLDVAGGDSFVVNYSGIRRDSVAELVRRMDGAIGGI
ncbi:MAG: PLP-dependent aminotransferase family protein [Treponema sp.]|nr:PLP-dependent aminotransferase family protein [Treponema sp.]